MFGGGRRHREGDALGTRAGAAFWSPASDSGARGRGRHQVAETTLEQFENRHRMEREEFGELSVLMNRADGQVMSAPRDGDNNARPGLMSHVTD